MPRAQNPILNVIRYFEQSTLPEAELALTIVKETVAKRRKTTPTKVTKPRAPIAPTPPEVAEVGGAVDAAPAPKPKRKRRMTANSQTPPVRQDLAEAREEDVELPGMVAEVGSDDDLNQSAADIS
jgi:hypothetical protein